MPELGYAVVWRGHVFDGREAKEQSLEIRLLTTAHLGVMLGNCCEQSVLVIKVPTDQRFRLFNFIFKCPHTAELKDQCS